MRVYLINFESLPRRIWYIYCNIWSSDIMSYSKECSVMPNAFFCARPNKVCGVLRDLVPFVQFNKREKHPFSLQLYQK